MNRHVLALIATVGIASSAHAEPRTVKGDKAHSMVTEAQEAVLSHSGRHARVWNTEHDLTKDGHVVVDGKRVRGTSSSLEYIYSGDVTKREVDWNAETNEGRLHVREWKNPKGAPTGLPDQQIRAIVAPGRSITHTVRREDATGIQKFRVDSVKQIELEPKREAIRAALGKDDIWSPFRALVERPSVEARAFRSLPKSMKAALAAGVSFSLSQSDNRSVSQELPSLPPASRPRASVELTQEYQIHVRGLTSVQISREQFDVLRTTYGTETAAR
jgi:hypothetical protein